MSWSDPTLRLGSGFFIRIMGLYGYNTGAKGVVYDQVAGNRGTAGTTYAT